MCLLYAFCMPNKNLWKEVNVSPLLFSRGFTECADALRQKFYGKEGLPLMKFYCKHWARILKSGGNYGFTQKVSALQL